MKEFYEYYRGLGKISIKIDEEKVKEKATKYFSDFFSKNKSVIDRDWVKFWCDGSHNLWNMFHDCLTIKCDGREEKYEDCEIWEDVWHYVKFRLCAELFDKLIWQ